MNLPARFAGLPRSGETRLVAAVIGLNLAFLPLFVLLLPRRIDRLFGPEAPFVLSIVLIAGAITASLGNIGAGRIGDRWLARHGNRRGLIGWCLPALLASYGAIAAAETRTGLIAAIAVFQLSLNLVFAPIIALLADHIPPARRGTIAGAMGTALPLAALATGALGWLFKDDSNAAFAVLAGLVALLVAPLPLQWGMGQTVCSAAGADPAPPVPTRTGNALSRLWLARLLVQVTAAFVLNYLFLRLSGLIAAEPAWAGLSASGEVARLSAIGGMAAIAGAAGSGWVSDRSGSRRGLLIAAALALAVSLAALGTPSSPGSSLLAFALFQLALSAYLTVDSAWVAGLVAGNERRGFVLGLMNLTNTLPAILAPTLTLAALKPGQLAPILESIYLACAVAAVLAAMLVASLRPRAAK
jgi:MFS family permease